jgi:hypothetical protein
MKKTTSISFAIVIFLIMTVASGDDFVPGSSSSARSECLELFKERVVAFKAEDWQALNTIARRFIDYCPGVYSRRDIATTYGISALSEYEMKRFRDALVQAKAGIAVHYLVPENHLQKVKALVALDNIVEAKEALRVADQIINTVMENHVTEQHSSGLDEELHRLRLENYERIQTELHKYRVFLYEKKMHRE